MKWISFVHSKYYKVIENGRTDFTKGLNILKGESDRGKSTTLKAIRKCLLNLPDESVDSFLTWWAPRGAKTEVTVGIKDDFDGKYSDEDAPETLIIRRMGKACNEYAILYPGETEPVVYAGFGKTVPPEVMAVHGMRYVDLGYGKDCLNYAGQFDPFFLTSRRPEEIANALGRLAHTEALEGVKTGLRSDLAVNKRQWNEAKDELKDAEVKLSGYDYLTDEAEILEKVGQCIVSYNDIAQRVEVLATSEKNIRKIARDIAHYDTLSKDRTDYPKAITLLEEAETAVKTYGEVSRVKRDVKRLSETIEDSSEVLRTKEDVDRSLELLTKAEERSGIYLKVREQAFAVSKLQKALVASVDTIKGSAIDLPTFEKHMLKATGRIETHGTLTKKQKEVESLAKTLRQQTALSNTLQESVEIANREIKEMMADKCPVCGQDVTGVDFETIKAHINMG